MVGVEAALEIRVLHRHGKSIREIARETGVARNTVRRICATRRRHATSRVRLGRPSSTRSRPMSRSGWARRRRSGYRRACC